MVYIDVFFVYASFFVVEAEEERSTSAFSYFRKMVQSIFIQLNFWIDQGSTNFLETKFHARKMNRPTVGLNLGSLGEL